jgi:hypothetical protein
MRFLSPLLALLSLALCLIPRASADDVYQWSVPVYGGEDRRAYLWIPPGCRQVRGLILGLNNMQEEYLFMNDAFRKNLADLDLGIVWIFPGFAIAAGNDQPPLSGPWPNGEQGQKDIVKVLSDLAKESGYPEIQYAPLLPIAHSAASPFVWGISRWSDRVFAGIPLKGYYAGGPAANVPYLTIGSEWAEVGGPGWGVGWETYRQTILRIRSSQPGEQDVELIGNIPDMGAGHYNSNPDLVPIINLFIRKAVEARLPEHPPSEGPVALKPITASMGALADSMKLGTPGFHPVPYDEYKGDKKLADWFLDTDLANAINEYVMIRIEKKPEMIDALDEEGHPVSLDHGGVAEVHPFIAADGTFKVKAVYLDKSPHALIYGGGPLGHCDVPILYRVSSGGLKQVGPDTFRIWAHRGNLSRQSLPWEPHIMAWSPGNAEYRSADRPIHPEISNHLTEGAAQTIDFPQIPNQPANAKSIQLKAAASSGLPVQFFVVSGPATLSEDNKTLLFTPIPAEAKMPVRIRIGAYQWGSPNEPKFQTAPVAIQEFFLGGNPKPDQLVPVDISSPYWENGKTVTPKK